MIDIDNFRESILGRLKEEGLLEFVDLRLSQFLDLDAKIVLQIVVSDASLESDIQQAIAQWLKAWTGPPVEWSVRSLWSIKEVRPPEQARSATGGIVAATVVPVILESGAGRLTQTVFVIVTYQARQELQFVMGRDPDLIQLAESHVASRLRRQGSSAWNPRLNDRLEIDAEAALGIRRTLAKTA